MKDNQFGCRLNFESSEGKTALYSLEKLQKRWNWYDRQTPIFHTDIVGTGTP